jgi:hypothetical protein
MALANCLGDISGRSLVSISLSFITDSRLKSLPDFFEVDLFLIASCPSCRYDADDFVGLRVCDSKDDTLQQPECNEPAFRVLEPIIQYSHRLVCKQGSEIREVYAVFSRFDWRFRSSHSNRTGHIVTTECSYVNLDSSAGTSGRDPKSRSLQSIHLPGLIHRVFNDARARLGEPLIDKQVYPNNSPLIRFSGNSARCCCQGKMSVVLERCSNLGGFLGC